MFPQPVNANDNIFWADVGDSENCLFVVFTNPHAEDCNMRDMTGLIRCSINVVHWN